MSLANKTILVWGPPKITVDDYESMLKEPNEQEKKKKIAKVIEDRFTERYVTPLSVVAKENKNGFCTRAVCCLMIEALESFRRGWKRTPNGELAFCSFFNSNDNLKEFRGHAEAFYKHVRCGLLHQAETTGGWRITRLSGQPLFIPSTKTIHATKFHNRLKRCLADYSAALEREPWNGELWTNFRKKMKEVIRNCQP